MKQLTALYCLVALLFAPRVGTAIDLRWSSGGQSLSFEGARTCTLVVEAEASQTQLPHEWRIVWAVEGCMITVLAAEPSALWRADTAEVCEIDQAVSATDVEAHQTMAYMCSDGDLPARRAVIPIAIDRAGRGKFRALALEGAAVPGQAIARSAEVTFNGGSAATYPPIILNAISTHDANHVLVEALGTGFDRLDGFAVAGADTSWRVNLDVQTLSDTTVLGTAVVSARLPEGVLRGTTSDGALAFASLPPDELVEPMALGPAVSMWDSSGYIRPKDFSLSYDGMGKFHIFYMRENVNQSTDALKWKKIAHVTTADWVHFSPQDTSFATTSNTWEQMAIWAPHVIQRGPTYYMFYTGVDPSFNQSIGLAWTNDINTSGDLWQRRSTPVFTSSQVQWADHGNHPGDPEIDFCDPFVMVDSVQSANTYLMFYATTYDTGQHKAVVGAAVARDTSLMIWDDAGPMHITDPYTTFQELVESPHAFSHVSPDSQGAPRDTSWYLAFTTGADDASLMYARHKHHILDNSRTFHPNAWNDIRKTWFNALPPDQRVYVQDLSGSEHLKVSGHEYFAGYSQGPQITDNRIWVMNWEWLWTSWSRPDTFQIVGSVADVPHRRGARRVGASLRMLGFKPGMTSVILRMSVGVATRGRLSVFDVLGRRVRTLFEGPVRPGDTDLTWDGRSGTGQAGRTGMYFVRLESASGCDLVRVPIVR